MSWEPDNENLIVTLTAEGRGIGTKREIRLQFLDTQTVRERLDAMAHGLSVSEQAARHNRGLDREPGRTEE